ncbi:hypothetical protein K466DRAFT_371627 [Polyporus arcularius HHB13444]|uniref:Uncharacterized protein n=1 Tax=Polyporus arcularius HHB13444 TaxID=1314778 RepID=A0A5C3P4B5_9APHY|nr:hypothetical protein K466DRAFT_371627 [Polyporus arcularius HHB13444]
MLCFFPGCVQVSPLPSLVCASAVASTRSPRRILAMEELIWGVACASRSGVAWRGVERRRCARGGSILGLQRAGCGRQKTAMRRRAGGVMRRSVWIVVREAATRRTRWWGVAPFVPLRLSYGDLGVT